MSFKSIKILFISFLFLLFFIYISPLVWPLSWFTPSLVNAEQVIPSWYMQTSTKTSQITSDFPFPANKKNKLPSVLNTSRLMHFISFSNLKINSIEKDSDYLYSPSLYGKGYIRYQKYSPNMKLEFFSPYGRKFWESPEHAYPVMGNGGNLSLLLSSNNYKCSVINKDGKILNRFEGPFLIDIAFAATTIDDNTIKPGSENTNLKSKLIEHVAFTFMGGILFVVDDKGKAIYKLDRQNHYFKSIALSPNAKYLLLHAKPLEGNDYFELINTSSRETEFKQASSGIIPHKVYMAVNNSGTSLIQYINRTLLLDNSGDIISRFEPRTSNSKNSKIPNPFSIKKDYIHSENGIYNPVSAAKNLFIFGRAKTAYLINNNGRIINIFHKQNRQAWRFHFSADSRTLVIEDKSSLQYYSIKEY